MGKVLDGMKVYYRLLSAVNEAECMYNTHHAVSWNHSESVLQLYHICQICILLKLVIYAFSQCFLMLNTKM